MSDLDELEEIAEQTAFGTGGQTSQGARGHRSGRPRAETCGAGHERTPENTRTYRQGKRIRSVCRVCDRERAAAKKVRERERTEDGKHVRYSARNYPL